MTRTTVGLAIFAAASLVAACGESAEPRGTAGAGQRAGGASPLYADADRDGRVTREEANVDPALAQSFERYDADANGELDSAEFARLETGAQGAGSASAAQTDGERHQLRPRREFPRPLD